MYGKIWYDEDAHDLRSVETEFPTIVLNDALTPEVTLSCEPTDLKTDSENDNDKVNMPSFPSSKPTVSYFNDLDFFKDFENEFPAIVYNDALTSKLNFLTEPTVSPQHIDEFNLRDETSLSKCDEEKQNILYFNDLFPLNVIYPDDSKSDKDNDDDKIDIKHSLGGNVMNTDDGVYAQRKIRRICACTSQKTMKKTRINTPYPGKTNTPYSSYGNKIFSKISNVFILVYVLLYATYHSTGSSDTHPIVSLVGPASDPRDQRVRSQLIGKDLVSGLLAYELPLRSLRKKCRLNLKNDMPPRDNEETLELAEESRLKMLAKQNDPSLKEKKVNIAPVDYVALNILSEHFVKHFVPQKQLSAEQAYWLPISKPVSKNPPVPSEPVLKKEIPRELPSISLAFEKDVKPFAQTLKEYFRMFELGLNKELKEMKSVFTQMEIEVAKCSVDKKYFEIEKKELSLDNDRLLEHIICQDVMNIVMHANDQTDNVLPANNNSLEHDNSALDLLKHENDRLIELLISQDLSFVDEYNETLVLKAEIAKKNDMIEKAVYKVDLVCSGPPNLVSATYPDRDNYSQ
ncbi:hypothetical protein Tco_0530429 [Tanacetum coccineum]